MRDQRAQHVGQPLTAQGEERDVLGGAVLERDVEGAGMAAARLAHDGDAVVEGRHALQDGGGVVEGAAVDGDEVPVGEGLRLQRADGLPDERAGVLGGHHDGDGGRGAQPGRERGRRPDQLGPLQHDLATPGGGRLDRGRAVGAPGDLLGQDPRRQGRARPGHREPVGQRAVGVVPGLGVGREDDPRVDQRVGRDPVAPPPLGDVPEDGVLAEALPRAPAPDPLGLEERVRRDVAGLEGRARRLVHGVEGRAELGPDVVGVDQAGVDQDGLGVVEPHLARPATLTAHRSTSRGGRAARARAGSGSSRSVSRSG